MNYYYPLTVCLVSNIANHYLRFFKIMSIAVWYLLRLFPTFLIVRRRMPVTLCARRQCLSVSLSGVVCPWRSVQGVNVWVFRYQASYARDALCKVSMFECFVIRRRMPVTLCARCQCLSVSLSGVVCPWRSVQCVNVWVFRCQASYARDALCKVSMFECFVIRRRMLVMLCARCQCLSVSLSGVVCPWRSVQGVNVWVFRYQASYARDALCKVSIFGCFVIRRRMPVTLCARCQCLSVSLSGVVCPWRSVQGVNVWVFRCQASYARDALCCLSMFECFVVRRRMLVTLCARCQCLSVLLSGVVCSWRSVQGVNVWVFRCQASYARDALCKVFMFECFVVRRRMPVTLCARCQCLSVSLSGVVCPWRSVQGVNVWVFRCQASYARDALCKVSMFECFVVRRRMPVMLCARCQCLSVSLSGVVCPWRSVQGVNVWVFRCQASYARDALCKVSMFECFVVRRRMPVMLCARCQCLSVSLSGVVCPWRSVQCVNVWVFRCQASYARDALCKVSMFECFVVRRRMPVMLCARCQCLSVSLSGVVCPWRSVQCVNVWVFRCQASYARDALCKVSMFECFVVRRRMPVMLCARCQCLSVSLSGVVCPWRSVQGVNVWVFRCQASYARDALCKVSMFECFVVRRRMPVTLCARPSTVDYSHGSLNESTKASR